MRFVVFLLALTLTLITALSNDAWAQSGNRGSSSRARPAMRPGGFQGRPSRIGPSRPTVARPTAAPTGMLNSVRSMPRSSGSALRQLPSTGIARPSSRYGIGGTSGSYDAVRRSPAKRRKPSGPKSSSSRDSTTLTSSTAESSTGLRVWSDASGKHSIRGELAAFQNGTVWIRRADGLLAKLPLSQLSRVDQLLVATSSR